MITTNQIYEAIVLIFIGLSTEMFIFALIIKREIDKIKKE